MAFNNKKKNANYISAKESRAIARENRKITQEIEKKRNRKHIPEEEYVHQDEESGELSLSSTTFRLISSRTSERSSLSMVYRLMCRRARRSVS